MSSRIPPLLEPYLTLPPEASLILLTSVLGASSNWLVLRFLHSTLLPLDSSPDISGEDDTKVLLGLDLDKLAARKKFQFVDGLSGLFLPRLKVHERGGHKVLSNATLDGVSADLLNGIQELKASQNPGHEGRGKILLLADQLDLLLAAGGNQIGAVGMGEMLMGLREHVHSSVITLSADYPLVSVDQTPLEINHATLLLSMAHEADLIMSLRLLDTGMARDVSGVIRITKGDGSINEQKDIQKGMEEKELLYFVGGDGGVRVFERGQ
ncbi:hypothetical protein B7494_g5515 [Chlorociboria aeruginascens]|nr:hypothetical protein B7494_g5515 [Chlorociboria aeruginascens]